MQAHPSKSKHLDEDAHENKEPLFYVGAHK